MSRNTHNSSGFTIIELLLAMTFLSFILIFMSLALVQMIKTYDKGLTIKQVNQAGRTVTDDIARAIRGELPGSVNLTNVAAGRLCVGNVMYVWNPLFVGPPASRAVNPSLDTYRFGAESITMARLRLPPTNNCDAPVGVIARNQDNYSILGDRARVLWASADRNGTEPLVKLTFVLGTYDITERARFTPPFSDIYNTPYYSNGQPTCRPGNDGNYCAFAEFSTIVYLPNEQ